MAAVAVNEDTGPCQPVIGNVSYTMLGRKIPPQPRTPFPSLFFLCVVEISAESDLDATPPPRPLSISLTGFLTVSLSLCLPLPPSFILLFFLLSILFILVSLLLPPSPTPGHRPSCGGRPVAPAGGWLSCPTHSHTPGHMPSCGGRSATCAGG